MDQYISLPRLVMYMQKVWFEQKKTLLLLFCAIAAMMTIWMSLYYSFSSPALFRPSFQVAYYFLGLYVSGFLSASFLFSEFRSKPRAISFLMLPAAQLEKFISILFFGVVVFWAGYSAIFTTIDFVFVSMINNKFASSHAVINVLKIHDYTNPFLPESNSSLYYIYFTFHALFILGSIYFHGYSFFKTLIVLLIVWLTFFMLPSALHGLLPPGTWVSSIASYEVFHYHGGTLLELPGWFRVTIFFFLGYLVMIALWAAAYFRLSERQIV
jgi:hypothetical protein